MNPASPGPTWVILCIAEQTSHYERNPAAADISFWEAVSDIPLKLPIFALVALSLMETRWGKRLGRYEIVAELGRGAMGTVYKARDPKINRFVAIKTIALHAQGLEDKMQVRERFFVEAQAAGRLLHPGIVTVFDVGEEPESSDPYIVMEYISGQTLRDLLAGGNRLPLDTALRMTQELAEALDYAHAQGVVHRDIKPANILVTKKGHAKIGDFGIAQLNLSHITLPGRVLGTPAYMSPEQLEGQEVDGRSDLFSLGAILYALVTGFSPFQGNSATTVCFKVANREPLQASSLAPEIPAELDSLIARALAKDPSDRYQRGMEFALDIRELRQRGRLASTRDKKAPSLESKNAALRSDSGTNSDSSQAAFSIIRSSQSAARMTGRVFQDLLSWFSSLPAPVRHAIPVLSVALILTFFALRPHPAHIAPPSMAAHPSVAAQSANEQQVSTSAEIRTTPAGAPPSRPHAALANSTLEVHIENHFSDATLSCWIDNKLVYSHSLRDGHKKRLVLLGGGAKETITLALSAGKHELRVRVQSAKANYEQSRRISDVFLKDASKVLSINFAKHTHELQLKLQ